VRGHGLERSAHERAWLWRISAPECDALSFGTLTGHRETGVHAGGLRKTEKVALVGFSMGGNQVLRTVGLWGAARPSAVIAAATVSPACDPSIHADHLHKAPGFVYEWWFLQSLRSSFRRKSGLCLGDMIQHI